MADTKITLDPQMGVKWYMAINNNTDNMPAKFQNEFGIDINTDNTTLHWDGSYFTFTIHNSLALSADASNVTKLTNFFNDADTYDKPSLGGTP